MALIGQATTYLERAVDGLISLPSDLQRLLATIRAIDEQLDELRTQSNKQCEQVLSLPGESSRSATPEQLAQVAQLREQIEKDQERLLFLANEKVQLAQQALNLVGGVTAKLDSDMATFAEELALHAEENMLFGAAAPAAPSGADAADAPPAPASAPPAPTPTAGAGPRAARRMPLHLSGQGASGSAGGGAGEPRISGAGPGPTVKSGKPGGAGAAERDGERPRERERGASGTGSKGAAGGGDGGDAPRPAKMHRSASTADTSAAAPHSQPPPERGRDGQRLLQKGDQVAACVSDPQSGDEWIMASVVRHIPETGQYAVQDDDPGEGEAATLYQLSPLYLIALPKGNTPRDGPNLGPGTPVLAVYPGTTTFYKATIVSAARRHKNGEYGDYLLEFEDDEDVGGLPQRPVQFRYVVSQPVD